MYSEKIDTILEVLENYNKDLRSLCLKIIRDIFSFDSEAHTLNVMYYTDGRVTNWNFLGVKENGYGSALTIASINTNPVFVMIDEDGNEFEDRTLFDFDTTELTYLVRMLNDILEIVKNEGKVNTEMDWDY